MTLVPDHLSDAFTSAVAREGDREFLIEGDRRLSWTEVENRVDTLARAFVAKGLVPGERIAIDLRNGVEWVVILLAASRAGLAVVPLDPSLGFHELKYLLRHSEVAAALIPEVAGPFDFLELFDEILPDLPALRLISYVGPGDRWFDDRAIPFADLISLGAKQKPLPEVPESNSELAIIYTSGTMGKPKGVRLSHRAMLLSAKATAEALAVGSDDRVLLSVPLFHVFGLGILLAAIEVAATVVLEADFVPVDTLSTIKRESVSHIPGTPTMFELMMRSPSFEPTQLASVSGGVIGGAAVTPDSLDRIRIWCDAEVAYGLTETGPTVSCTRRGDPIEKRRTTVGRPVAGIEVGVVDLKRGTMHYEDAVGELAVQGESLMDGYHRMPDETARSFTVSGHLLTGDLAHIDEDGFISVVARRKEVIVRAGSSVTPREIEDVLRTHPGVEGVCVVGVPDDVLGELVVACIVLIEGAIVTGGELDRFCHDVLAANKVPDRIRFLDSFPTTASGKVRRMELARVMELEVDA